MATKEVEEKIYGQRDKRKLEKLLEARLKASGVEKASIHVRYMADDAVRIRHDYISDLTLFYMTVLGNALGTTDVSVEYEHTGGCSCCDICEVDMELYFTNIKLPPEVAK